MVGFVAFLFLSVIRSIKLTSVIKGSCIVLVLLVVTALFLPQTQKDRFRSIWDSSASTKSAEESKLARVDALRAAWTIFSSSPWHGVGLDNFIDYRFEYVDGGSQNPHNLAAQLLAETGILGGVAFFLMLWVAYRNCRRCEVASRSIGTTSVIGELAFAVRNTLILLLIMGLAHHNLYRYHWYWLAAFALLAAEFSAAIRRDPEAYSEELLET